MIAASNSTQIPVFPIDGPSIEAARRPRSATSFVHAPAPGAELHDDPIDQWWRRFRDAALDTLVDCALQYSHEISAAQLKLQAHWPQCVALEAPSDADAPDARSLAQFHQAWQALSEFYATQVRLIADVARRHFTLLMLRERIAAVEFSLHRLRVALERTRHASGGPQDSSRQLPSVLAEIHALRIRLRQEYDSTVIALARTLGEPLSITFARMGTGFLPAAAAQPPNPGSPENLPHRRPDIRAAFHAVQARRSLESSPDAIGVREARLAHERATADAVSQVESALLKLSSRCEELTPVRAAALNLENLLTRVQDLDLPTIGWWLQLERSRYSRQDDEIIARGDTYLSLVDLFEALGGGWSVEAMAGSPYEGEQVL
ncbi:hypothetical protein ASD53_01510 [Lysobacter sp. Root559]|nr:MULTISPECIES: hypothetical protein [unclassified Lysobacter]KQZ68007.1 hypothetical protein ASD53_01510 [Lysobacter sp. Root559]KRA74893.1 hypothetical protein ASD78_11350 [Lysobacter sp. Root667]KRC38333.1 hypothetical protein ASE10_01855 [Lysobacter sp. Root76]KRD69657.1 hypothetical protein ASE45_11140 [Lysobacter sp. Root96]